jgi:hypothetical protein
MGVSDLFALNARISRVPHCFVMKIEPDLPLSVVPIVMIRPHGAPDQAAAGDLVEK